LRAAEHVSSLNSSKLQFRNLAIASAVSFTKAGWQR
jgi:hypothetical protein